LLTQLLARAGLTAREILREKGTPYHDLASTTCRSPMTRCSTRSPRIPF